MYGIIFMIAGIILLSVQWAISKKSDNVNKVDLLSCEQIIYLFGCILLIVGGVVEFVGIA